jgi:hypothetical protein
LEITPASIPTELPATEVPIPAPAEPTALPHPPAAQPSSSTHAPLGVSRAYMMDQYGVFVFQKPYTTDYGVEAIMGYHQTMCIDKDCAAITLMGPADNLLLIGMAVPTNPNDDVEITSAIALLGHLTFDITKDDSFSGQLIKDFVDAVTSQKTLDKKYNVNGFIISESVKPNNGHFVAAMTITK